MLYSYRCNDCDHITEVRRPLVEMHDPVNCERCQGETRQIITPPMLSPVLGGGDWPGYECPETGEYVTSRKRRREILRENDLIEVG